MLLRDLEEARAKRIALENPPPKVADPPIKLEPTPDAASTQESAPALGDSLVPPLKPENLAGAAEAAQAGADEVAVKGPDHSKVTQGPSPPSSNDATVTTNAANTIANESAAGTDPNTAGTVDASVDSLLTVSLGDGNNDDMNLNFDDMDFSQFTTNIEDNSQSQANDFLSTFGNEDFNMPDLQATTNAEAQNTSTESKKDDLLDMAIDTAENDTMDLDYFNPADGSSFDDLFAGGDDANVAEGGSMESDNYDSAFFNTAS